MVNRLLNMIAEQNGIKTDIALAEYLGVGRGTVSRWRIADSCNIEWLEKLINHAGGNFSRALPEYDPLQDTDGELAQLVKEARAARPKHLPLLGRIRAMGTVGWKTGALDYLDKISPTSGPRKAPKRDKPRRNDAGATFPGATQIAELFGNSEQLDAGILFFLEVETHELPLWPMGAWVTARATSSLDTSRRGRWLVGIPDSKAARIIDITPTDQADTLIETPLSSEAPSLRQPPDIHPLAEIIGAVIRQ